jgi:acyl dehydratase/NADP-dependent 3-hydroxy acid dehydrogenase YdfG
VTSTFQDELAIRLEDSQLFSKLSGDFNPLHIDPVAARRLRFGSTVVHGIHVLLASLDALAARGQLGDNEPASISATFDAAVPTGGAISLQTSIEGVTMRLSAAAGGQRALNAIVELRPAERRPPSIVDAEHERSSPRDLDFPPAQSLAGSVGLTVSTTLLRTLFPALAASPNIGWVADLLATTHIVGMHCPGLHSIFSGLRLRRSASTGSPAMRFSVGGLEKRMQLLRIQVAGTHLQGAIEAFFRPRPVRQRAMSEIAAIVAPHDFAGTRALVVGGSRGLGEVTAKILAAGGAEVTITYARGREDAESVCESIQAVGRSCAVRSLDVTQPMTAADREWLHTAKFTHVCFFASPRIGRNAGPWDDQLFRQFELAYVTAFAKLAEAAVAPRSERRTVCFLYPSSIFVSQPAAGFAEYAVAKAAGEALCEQLQLRQAGKFAKPRLPRLQTDQTSSVVGTAQDPLPVMLEVVRDLHSMS